MCIQFPENETIYLLLGLLKRTNMIVFGPWHAKTMEPSLAQSEQPLRVERDSGNRLKDEVPSTMTVKMVTKNQLNEVVQMNNYS